jgi:exodeoxyribonuclease V alpha subunit
VVIVLTSSAYIMLQRNLLYTAVTRAKEKCIIVGDRKAIETTVSNWRLRPRYTRLRERISNNQNV